ncbi:MAG: hypothetical protein WC804_11490 [Sphingomonas sp.]|jgi:hypothetical protein|uniref:hypothetical protein n=1 Tax=Sphingomonas sp. TaxID=28214 RepID=UPI0035658522
MASSVQSRLAAERRFYSSMALFMIVLVVAGFAPSFYLRGIVHAPRPNPTLPPAVMLHGLMFSLWMIIFWAQTALIAAGRRATHIRLGVAGMIFATLLVPVMYLTAVGQVARANQPPFATPLGWTIVPLALIPAFIALVALGWNHRRDAQAHKRLMLGAALLMMDPAIGRLPIVPPVPIGFAILGLLSWLTFAPLFWWDFRTLGKLHWATRFGAGLFGCVLILRLPLISSPTWAVIAAHLPGI